MKNKYDFIITGSGASGLILAYRMIHDDYYQDKSILLIDKDQKDSNDRTWCFWEKGQGEWDDILEKSWKNIAFKSAVHSETISIQPYTYKMIRSADFYKKIHAELNQNSNFSMVYDTVETIEEIEDVVKVQGRKEAYQGGKVLNSIVFDNAYRNQRKYPVLKQHFLGWFIKTEEDYFDDQTATFMDFTVKQQNNTRFMYILPMSKKEALFEYTLFSEDLLTTEEYESAIKKYLEEKGITKYTIVEKENGIIPMTCYKFWEHNSKNVLNLGTVGGWSKASTGYTFMNIGKKTKELVDFLKTGKDLNTFHKTSRFWYYDLLLLDVLHKENGIGSKVFGYLFKRNKTHQIFKFLDEETSFPEEFRIMASIPPWRFIKALLGRIF